jgi:hypothetical protein
MADAGGVEDEGLSPAPGGGGPDLKELVKRLKIKLDKTAKELESKIGSCVFDLRFVQSRRPKGRRWQPWLKPNSRKLMLRKWRS